MNVPTLWTAKILHHYSDHSTHPIYIATYPAMDERLRGAAIESWRTGRWVRWLQCALVLVQLSTLIRKRIVLILAAAGQVSYSLPA
jgi:hypothetical protein